MSALARIEVYVDPAIRGKRRPREADRVVARLASEQHGVVARRQLLDAGIGARAIEERIGRGRLHPVHRGVYAVGHPLLSRRGRWMAAVLAAGPRAILSHRSAASLWALIAPSGRAVEVTRPTKARPRPGVGVHRSPVPADERTVVDGIPVTTVPRTIFDLAAVLPRRRLERAIAEAEVRGLTDALSLPDLLARYPGRRGTSALRAVLDDEVTQRGITRSELEERFVALLDAHRLPRPRLNAHLAVSGRFFEVDCLWEAERLVVELDGRAVHETNRAFEADRERDRLLLADGWRVTRLTWRQVCDDAEAIAADLRRLLAPSL